MNINEKIQILEKEIKRFSNKKIKIMEVCGTHTMSIAKFGIKSLLPPSIEIISGPGCPVCVSSAWDIGYAIELAKLDNTILATFGDMLKVPSGEDFLINYKNVKTIYSPMDAIGLSKENPDKEVILLGIGFETTSPLIATCIDYAKKLDLNNFSVFSINKTIPEALKLLIHKNSSIDALILPGHVSVITGSNYFNFLKDFSINGVITGFDALNIMESIYLIVKNINNNEYKIENNYKELVSFNGNIKAQAITSNVFNNSDSMWRGIGIIKNSGLEIKDKYSKFNARNKFKINNIDIKEDKDCICGEVLQGKLSPKACKHFGKNCTPSSPIGPCMVSGEGTCAAYFKYEID